ncbi:MAG: thioredoxin family protein [Labilithrix sp.]|nr:thioredoxin family protein [Labilithrix sp.]
MDAQPLRKQVALAAAALVAVACNASTTGAARKDGAPVAHETRAPAALRFIEDDYPKALAEAKRRGKPLFVDAWASWCHSCQSLRAYVLTDPTLAPLADDFVWLSIDTERDANADWLARHPHSALPTLWVIDPATDRPILKWAGTATAAELRELLEIAVVDARRGAESPATTATAAFVRGNHALAAGDVETAEKEHRAALAAAPKDHPHRARMVEALVTQLALRKEHDRCAEVAAAEANGMAPGTSRASVLVAGLGCAREAGRTADVDRLLEAALHDAALRDGRLLADDRSALYEEAFTTKSERGDAAGARELARAWSAFLEGEAAKATSNDARSSLDPLRLGAFLALGEPARAIPMLEESERDFPEDFNPPARLGRVYLEMKRLDDADKAADRATARVYGPRAMRVLALKADIAKARGDRAGEVKALEEALARSERAVLTEGQKGVRAGLVKRLAALR